MATGVGGADRAADLRSRAAQLRSETSALATQSHAAVLQLYALDSELTSARARAASLAAQAADVEQQRADARYRLRLARQTLRAAQDGLERRLLALYEGGDIDPLTVILGAASFDDAITRLDHASRLSELDRRIAATAVQAKRDLARLSISLASRESRLQGLHAQAEAAAASIASARAERSTYIAHLAAQRRLDESQIASFESQAQAAEQHAALVAASAPPPTTTTAVPAAAPDASAAPTPAATSGRQLTVVATAYSLPGYTASGLPVGPGIVAVDPTVIPMGTRMTIPGYGEGVAADTGTAIKGNRIDLWFPTYRQAAAWGAHTVTITLH